MKRAILVLLLVILSAWLCAASALAERVSPNPVVVITTSLGVIRAEIDLRAVPETAGNFLQYVDDKFYDQTIFNRVIAGFMIQGGNYTKSLQVKSTRPPIKNQGAKGRKNLSGTLAMAHLDDPDTATAHFFINVRDNADLDFQDAKNPGYCVFGKVVSGMDVVHKIEKTPTSVQKNLPDVPVTPVIIESIRRE